MSDNPHIHLANPQPAEHDAGGLTALAAELRANDLATVAVMVEQLDAIVTALQSVSQAIALLSQCDDARIADIRKLSDRLTVLEQLALVRDATEHSRRIGEL